MRFIWARVKAEVTGDQSRGFCDEFKKGPAPFLTESWIRRLQHLRPSQKSQQRNPTNWRKRGRPFLGGTRSITAECHDPAGNRQWCSDKARLQKSTPGSTEAVCRIRPSNRRRRLRNRRN